MKSRLTKRQARAFKRRWAMVNAAELDELRNTPVHVKFAQLAALMASVDTFGWRQGLAAEEDSVRERWKRLKSREHA